MPHTIQIIPAILAENEAIFLSQARAVSDSVPLVHIDVADGQFVSETTWADPEKIGEYLEVDCELHLMVTDPLAVARLFVDADVQQVKRILIHYESHKEQTAEILSQLSSYGFEVGVALNPKTGVEVIEECIEELDFLVCMGVEPGAQGNPFVPAVVEKIRLLSKTYPSLPIGIDGHVNEDTIPELLEAGASLLYIGSAIFGNEKSPANNIDAFKKIIHTLTQGQ